MCTPKLIMQQCTFLQYIYAHKSYKLKQCAPMFCFHAYIAKMYISAYLNWGVHIHTTDELTESNVAIALDEIVDNF